MAEEGKPQINPLLPGGIELEGEAWRYLAWGGGNHLLQQQFYHSKSFFAGDAGDPSVAHCQGLFCVFQEGKLRYKEAAHPPPGGASKGGGSGEEPGSGMGGDVRWGSRRGLAVAFGEGVVCGRRGSGSGSG